MDAYVKELARKVKRLEPDQSLVRRNNARKRVKKAIQALLNAMDREFPKISKPIRRRAAGVPMRVIGRNVLVKNWGWALKNLPLHELKKAVKSPNHRKILLATQALAKAGPA